MEVVVLPIWLVLLCLDGRARHRTSQYSVQELEVCQGLRAALDWLCRFLLILLCRVWPFLVQR